MKKNSLYKINNFHKKKLIVKIFINDDNFTLSDSIDQNKIKLN